jgi:hypothetical protein
MVCPKCQSESVSVVPAEVRLYRNPTRTISHAPMTPSPDVRVCLDCGWSEFSIPNTWLKANAGVMEKTSEAALEDKAVSASGAGRGPLKLPHGPFVVSR